MSPAQAGWPFVDSGPYPTRAGNRVTPWIDGEPAFQRIGAAIDAAHESVWVTVTFLWGSFRMPDDRGTALDVLERAARRGVDVRLICWRPDDETAGLRENAFWGSAEQVRTLEERHPHLKVRWDRAHPGYCQHQKSWLIDPGRETGTSFIGGINLNPHSVVAPGHRGEGQNHDLYVELAGPAVADVHHNFVQRWNEASERHAAGGRWGIGSEADLPLPDRIPGPRGDVHVQVQRTMHPGRLRSDGAFDFAAGERTNLDQYLAAIGAAERAIYLENQYLDVAEILLALEAALARGVEVVALVPMVRAPAAVETAEAAQLGTARARLGAFDGFSLCGIAGRDGDGRRRPVHVHATLMLVDDEWATVGSCNLHRYSLFGNAELNVAFWERATVRALRVALLREHLARDTSDRDVVEALRLFRRIAGENRQRHDRGDPDWEGLAVALDAAAYGRGSDDLG